MLTLYLSLIVPKGHGDGKKDFFFSFFFLFLFSRIDNEKEEDASEGARQIERRSSLYCHCGAKKCYGTRHYYRGPGTKALLRGAVVGYDEG